jgi:hypothetical protein
MDKRNFLKNITVILFKLSCELILVLAFLFILGLAAESVLPGIISERLNFTKFGLLIFLILIMIIYAGKRYDLYFTRKKASLVIVAPLVFFFFFIIGFSLIGFTGWEIAVTVILTLAIIFYFYKILVTEKTEAE